MNRMICRVTVLAAGLALSLAACERKPNPHVLAVPIVGEGSTFSAPLYKVWVNRYYANTGQEVIYTASGSSQGVDAVITGRAVFGGTDAPLTAEQLERTGGVVQIPTTLGAIAIVHNVAGAPTNLQLTPAVLAGIFLCEITDWHDERITGINPGLMLLPERIEVVHRSDGSGTTKVLTEYLSKVSPAWRERIGSSNTVEWPCGTSAKGNDGVMHAVKRTPASIGYVALNFARVARLPVAAIGTRGGQFVEPSLDSVTAAAAAAVTLGLDPLQTIVDVEGDDAYPISTFSYIVVRRDLRDGAEARALAHFLWWAVTDGQSYSSMLHYATLPPAVVAYAEQQIQAMLGKGGQPILAADVDTK